MTRSATAAVKSRAMPSSAVASHCRHLPAAGLYLRDVALKHMTGVICGWRIGAADLAALQDDLALINPGAEVIPSRLDGTRITLGPPVSSGKQP
jgi:hypothetical protein